MPTMLITKEVNTESLVEQLENRYNVRDYIFWLSMSNDQLYLTVPEGMGLEGAQEVLAAHDATSTSNRVQFRNRVLTIAASAAGVALADLTAAQIKSLMAVMLFKMGGIEPSNMTVKPLTEWT